MMRTRSVQKRGFHFGALVCLALLAACSRSNPNAAKVAKAIDLFNNRFNSSQFHEIYADADDRLRKSISEADFSSKLAGLRQQHGAIQSSSVNGFQASKFWHRFIPPSTQFIGYYNHCAVDGFQTFFIFDVTGDEAKLVEFYTDIDEHNRKLQH